MDLNPATQRRPIDGDTDAMFWDTVRRTGHSNPEQDLMLAVLKDALLSYRRNLRAKDGPFRDEREWFFNGESSELFSFESLCAVLGLDCRRIRRHLLAWEAQAGSGVPLD